MKLEKASKLHLTTLIIKIIVVLSGWLKLVFRKIQSIEFQKRNEITQSTLI